jgi:magnesium transporter
MSDLAQYIENKEYIKIQEWFLNHDVLEIVDELYRLESNELAVAFRLLPKDIAIEVFENMDPSSQGQLMASLRNSQVLELIEKMDPDDRVRLLEELPAKLAKEVLEGLSPKERRLTSILLGYSEETVGRVMSPEFVALRATMATAQALDKIRKSGSDAETIYMLPVTDAFLILVGVVSLRDLVLAKPDTLVSDIMIKDVYSARVDEDQEKAARLVQEADLLALPITDMEGRLVGVLTVDDAMEILEYESTEDILLGGASKPLEMPYLSASVRILARTRALWLLVLILAAALSVNILNYFEQSLESVVTLALFIPLLIDTGGNIGSQSATLIVRAIAVNEVQFRDFFKVIFRELRVGILLGLMLGIMAVFPVSAIFDPKIALVLSLSLITICIISAVAGAILPLTAHRVGVDPAVVSAPIITTLVDSTGLIIYFLIANAVLGI